MPHNEQLPQPPGPGEVPLELLQRDFGCIYPPRGTHFSAEQLRDDGLCSLGDLVFLGMKRLSDFWGITDAGIAVIGAGLASIDPLLELRDQPRPAFMAGLCSELELQDLPVQVVSQKRFTNPVAEHRGTRLTVVDAISNSELFRQLVLHPEAVREQALKFQWSFNNDRAAG